ncbi:hypothetical protein [Streptomyces sp. WMMC1477]|uniref:hypothetical protein n=1 Tax=unclassified Streptomyces TaxID=2593676 RepID=UPI003FCEB2F0
MGWTVLYILFGLVALWLLGEVLLQYKARLRWRLVAFFGFLAVVVGVLMRSVPVIALGTAGFGVGQLLVTLSFRRGFEKGWALENVPGSRRRRSGEPGEEEGADGEPPGPVDAPPVLEVSGLEQTAAYQMEPLPEDTGEYGVYERDAESGPGRGDGPEQGAPYPAGGAGPEQGGHAPQNADPYADPYAGQYADAGYATPYAPHPGPAGEPDQHGYAAAGYDGGAAGGYPGPEPTPQYGGYGTPAADTGAYASYATYGSSDAYQPPSADYPADGGGLYGYATPPGGGPAADPLGGYAADPGYGAQGEAPGYGSQGGDAGHYGGYGHDAGYGGAGGYGDGGYAAYPGYPGGEPGGYPPATGTPGYDSYGYPTAGQAPGHGGYPQTPPDGVWVPQQREDPPQQEAYPAYQDEFGYPAPGQPRN